VTPYEKLRSIPGARVYLKKSVTFEMLDKKARRYTDNEMAKKVQLGRDKLFDKILAARLFLSGHLALDKTGFQPFLLLQFSRCNK